MTRIAIVGSYGKEEKQVLLDLLFTAEEQVGIRKFTSVQTLLDDLQRPNLDLVVLMPSNAKIDLPKLKLTLHTPILRLTIGTPLQHVEISDHIAVVELTTAAEARDQRCRFALAAMRQARDNPRARDWPIPLVPKEYLRS